MIDDAIGRAVAVLGPLAERAVPLAPFTTYRIGGPADVLVRARDRDDLVAVGRAVATSGLPLLVVGQGSNLLVADEGVRGIVVLLGDGFGSIETEPDPSGGVGAVLRVGAGVKLPVLARQSVAAGWTGLEWMVGVPGSVGGAVRMNAGGHGADVAASIVDAEIAQPDEARGLVIETWSAERLALGYRHSALRDGDVVLSARFAVGSGDPEAGRRALDEIVRWRREHQPGGANCGSVFTNPPGDSAGRLIDAAGAKGFRIGTASVSDKHANFIQADEGGRSADVWAVIRAVRLRVYQRWGVVLTPEVRTAGFDAALDLLPPTADPATSPAPHEDLR